MLAQDLVVLGDYRDLPQPRTMEKKVKKNFHHVSKLSPLAFPFTYF